MNIPEIKIEWIFDDIDDSARAYYELANAALENSSIVGSVYLFSSNNSDGMFDEIIPIELNDLKMQEVNARGAYIALYGEQDYPMITITTDTYEEIKNHSGTGLFKLYHELGHYLCGHLALKQEYEDMLFERLDAINNNELYYQEKEADEYAAKILGKETALMALKDILQKRIEFEKANPEYVQTVTMQECKNRIINMEKYK